VVKASFHSVQPSSKARYKTPCGAVTLLWVAVMFKLLVNEKRHFLELNTSGPLLLKGG
jgi:hypothetical protein